ncbi:MAG: hypothetical protein ACRDZS_02695, partial [Acidimicrobiales bacterium]
SWACCFLLDDRTASDTSLSRLDRPRNDRTDVPEGRPRCTNRQNEGPLCQATSGVRELVRTIVPPAECEDMRSHEAWEH